MAAQNRMNFTEKCLGGGEVPFNPKTDVADYGNFAGLLQHEIDTKE